MQDYASDQTKAVGEAVIERARTGMAPHAQVRQAGRQGRQTVTSTVTWASWCHLASYSPGLPTTDPQEALERRREQIVKEGKRDLYF